MKVAESDKICKADYQYFEVRIGNSTEESDNDFWMCIRGVRAPSVDEAERFLSADIARIGGHVIEVFPIERKTAESCYDFSKENQWPVFGR